MFVCSSSSSKTTFSNNYMKGVAQDPSHVSLTLSASDEYGDTSASKFSYPFLSKSSMQFPVKLCYVRLHEYASADDALLASPYKATTFTIGNTESGCQYAWTAAGSFVDIRISSVVVNYTC
jgi:hypothetical protein